MGRRQRNLKKLFENGLARQVLAIGPYLVPGNEIVVAQSLAPISLLAPIITGNSPYDGGNLLLTAGERSRLLNDNPGAANLVRRLYGSQEYMYDEQRFCLWIDDEALPQANAIPAIRERIEAVRQFRANGGQVAKTLALRPHQLRYTHQAESHSIIAPRVSSERRSYIPFGLLPADCIVSDSAQAIYDAELWHLSFLLSLVHMSWFVPSLAGWKCDCATIGLCYNTFPLPILTDKNKADLTRCAEDIFWRLRPTSRRQSPTLRPG